MALGWKSNYLRYKSFFLNVAGQYQKKNELKMFMEVLLSLSAVAIFGLFAIKPTLTTIATLIKDMQGKRQTLALMDEKIENLNQARKVYDEEKAGIELLKTAIPKSGGKCGTSILFWCSLRAYSGSSFGSFLFARQQGNQSH